MKNKSKIYYNLTKVLSYNRPVNLLIGGRGIGKTVACVDYGADEFLKTGEKMMYIRRYKTEVNVTKMEKLIQQLYNISGYEDYSFKFRNGKFFVAENFEKIPNDSKELKWKVFGEVITLTQALQSKGGDFAEFKTFIFDEFIITGNTLHYIKNEHMDFLELCESMFRTRTDIKFFMLSNSYNMINPYFGMLNFSKTEYGMYKTHEIALIEIIKTPDEIKTMKRKSISSLLGGKEYQSYSIDNEFFLQNGCNIMEKKPEDCEPLSTCKYDQSYFTIWYCKSMASYYACRKMFKDSYANYVVNLEEMEESYTMGRKNRQLLIFKRALNENWFYFDSEKTKQHCIEFFNKV